MDSEFKQLTNSPNGFQLNYQTNYNWFERKILFLHSYHKLTSLTEIIDHNDNNSKNNLKLQDLPQIKQGQSAIYLGQSMGVKLEEIKGELGDNPYQGDDVLKMLMSVMKWQILAVVLLLLAEIISKIIFSLLIKELITVVSEAEYESAYIFAVSGVLIWLIGALCKQNAIFEATIMSVKIKAGMVLLINGKLSKLSLYVIKNSEMGKFINMVSGDFNVIEQKLPKLLNAINFPIIVIIVTLLMMNYFHWIGLSFGVITIFVVIPLLNFISKINGGIVREISKVKDRRMKLSKEVIDQIKFIKMYGWEEIFAKQLQAIRSEQIHLHLKLGVGRALERSISFSITGVMVLFIFFYYGITDVTILTVPLMLSAQEITNNIKINLGFASIGIGFYYQLKVICERFASILNIDEMRMKPVDEQAKQIIPDQFNSDPFLFHPDHSQFQSQPLPIASSHELTTGQLQMINFNGYWSDDLENPSLKNINFRFNPSTLYGIAGQVGSGKSGLLAAFMQEIPYYSGGLRSVGSVGYVEQDPVLFSLTLKENILFGKEYQSQLYHLALKQSCLETDLKEMSNGDETFLGQRGAALSGGQRVRVSLARAIYANTDIYLLDDPISAVDSKVANQLFQSFLELKSQHKTILMVSHQISFLRRCDEVIIIKDGELVASGSPQKLENMLVDLEGNFSEHHKAQEEDQNAENQTQQKIEDKSEQSEEELDKDASSKAKAVTNALVEEKTRQKTPTVSPKSYYNYFFYTKVNIVLVPLTVIMFSLSEILNIMYLKKISSFDPSQLTPNSPNRDFFELDEFWVQAMVLQLSFFVVYTLKCFLVSLSILNVNQKLHNNAARSLIRSENSFFNLTPSGQLMNKFSNDLGGLDIILIINIIDNLEFILSIVISYVSICLMNWQFSFQGAACLGFVIWFSLKYNDVIIQSRSLQLKTKSPVFQQIGETCNGVIQIFIYKRRLDFLTKFASISNNESRASISFNLITRGYSTVVCFFITLIFLSGMISGISLTDPINAGQYGVCVILIRQICDKMPIVMRQVFTMLGLIINYERINQIVNLTPERELRNEEDVKVGLQAEISAANQDIEHKVEWNLEPTIEFKNLCAKYRQDLPLVLKNISLSIKKHQKVALVGRTGSGKSSVVLAILRMIEPLDQQSYLLGKYAASRLGLHSLRKHISVLPQKPFIFKGTIRQNLDPFNQKTNQQIWDALQNCGMKKSIEELPEELECMTTGSSQLFSTGQKQLLCLARALINKNNILLLDEATSNVDLKTDLFIQSVIREKCAQMTVISVAHRLLTIADYDKIIVMRKGILKEIGPPNELVNAKGIFYKMIGRTGPRNAQQIMQKIEQRFT